VTKNGENVKRKRNWKVSFELWARNDEGGKWRVEQLKFWVTKEITESLRKENMDKNLSLVGGYVDKILWRWKVHADIRRKKTRTGDWEFFGTKVAVVKVNSHLPRKQKRAQHWEGHGELSHSGQRMGLRSIQRTGESEGSRAGA
jgi:hypothetical protein